MKSYISAKHHKVNLHSDYHVLVEDGAKYNSRYYTKYGQNDIFPVYIGCHLFVVKAKYLECGYLPLSLQYVYAVQVVENHKGKESCCRNKHKGN